MSDGGAARTLIPVSFISGQVSFTNSTAGVVASVVDREASKEAGRLVLRSLRNSIASTGNGTPQDYTIRVGAQNVPLVGRVMDISGAKGSGRQADRFGKWRYEFGGLPPMSIVWFAVRNDVGASLCTIKTAIMVHNNAPALELLTDFAPESQARTGIYSMFRGRAYCLSLADLKALELPIPVADVMQYVNIIDVYEQGPDSLINIGSTKPAALPEISSDADELTIATSLNRRRRQFRRPPRRTS